MDEKDKHVSEYLMPGNPPKYVSGPELEEFIEAKGMIFPPCPVCGSKVFSWVTLTDTSNLLLITTIKQFKPGFQSDGNHEINDNDFDFAVVGYFQNTCDNCGYALQFDASEYFNWRKRSAGGQA